MQLATTNPYITRDDYLQGELTSDLRHEYIAGRVYAMSGGTLNHQRVAGNFFFLVKRQLFGKKCFPSNSDFKLRIPLGHGEEAFYYPDGMITCVPVAGDALFTDSPTVILEVLSPNTRRTDEVQKLRDYLTIPTLQTYILAESDQPYLTIYRRTENGFQQEIIAGVYATLELPEIELSIILSNLYQDVS